MLLDDEDLLVRGGQGRNLVNVNWSQSREMDDRGVNARLRKDPSRGDAFMHHHSSRQDHGSIPIENVPGTTEFKR